MDNNQSINAEIDDPAKNIQPKVTEFDKFLPWACAQYSIDEQVIVTRDIQEVYVSAAASQRKAAGSKRKQPFMMTQQEQPRSTATDDVDSDDHTQKFQPSSINNDKSITVQTIYDKTENLVQLQFLSNKAITQKVMKVVAFTIPYNKYLTSITINSGLRKETLHEIAKFLPDSNIIELCLDGTFVREGNYHVLLTTHNKLKHLSLAKCSINDAVVKTIMDELVDDRPASKVLSALNLSSNRITDVGAKYVACMLRTNRQLSYLNLAGNTLADEGGMCILDTLQTFVLESQELLESRAKYMAYLRNKFEYIAKMVKELQTAEEEKNSKRKNTRQNVQRPRQKLLVAIDGESRTIQEKAERMAEVKLGLFNNPFSPDNTESQNGVVRCYGNNTLCYLNLAYNNLTYVSVKKLLNVLQMQMSLNRTPRGLIKVVIEGNLLPVACSEFKEIDRLLAVDRVTKETSVKKKPVSSASFTTK